MHSIIQLVVSLPWSVLFWQAPSVQSIRIDKRKPTSLALIAPNLESDFETEDKLELEPSLLMSQVEQKADEINSCTAPCKHSAGNSSAKSTDSNSTKKICLASHHTAIGPHSGKKVCVSFVLFCERAKLSSSKHIFCYMKHLPKKN